MAEANLDAKIASLAKTAESLNRASNSINTTLDTVEKKLVAAKIGLEVWLSGYLSPVMSSIMLEPHFHQIHGQVERSLQRQLGFTKLNGKWCLAVRGIETNDGYFERDVNCLGM